MNPGHGSAFEPRILVAMPSLQDGYFDRSVILLCEYNSEGAMGFVINSPSNTTVDDLSFSAGFRKNWNRWSMDASATYGENEFGFFISNSANTSIGPPSPTAACSSS